jgi:hypothetical protein
MTMLCSLGLCVCFIVVQGFIFSHIQMRSVHLIGMVVIDSRHFRPGCQVIGQLSVSCRLISFDSCYWSCSAVLRSVVIVIVLSISAQHINDTTTTIEAVIN